MRLRQTFATLEANAPLLTLPPKSDHTLPNGQPGFYYDGMRVLLNAVDAVAAIPGLEPEIAAVRRLPLAMLGADQGVSTQQDWSQLATAVKELEQVCRRLLALLASAVQDVSPFEIDLKLPPVDSLDEFKKLIGELQLAFDRPVQLVLKAHIKLEGVDSGSMWLVLVVGSEIVLRFTFGLLLAANHFMRKQAENDRYLEGTKAIVDDGNYQRTIEEANGKMMNALSDSLAKQLLEGTAADAEAVATTLVAIKTLAGLRSRGLEMQLTDKAPPAIRRAVSEHIVRTATAAAEISPVLPRQLTAGLGDEGGDVDVAPTGGNDET